MGRNIYISEREIKAIERSLKDLESQIEAWCSKAHEKEIRPDIAHLKSVLRKYHQPQTNKYAIKENKSTLSQLILKMKSTNSH